MNPQYLSDTRAIRLVCIAIVLAFSYGVWYSYSVFLVALFEEFGWSRSTLALGFSIFAVVHGVSNPVVGRLCDKINPAYLVVFGGTGVSLSLLYVSFIETPAQLFFGFGVLTAISVALCGWAPSLVQVQRNHKARLGFAIGFISSGIGVGMLLIVPLVQLLIQNYGWRLAYQIFALISVCVIVPIGIFLIKLPSVQSFLQLEQEQGVEVKGSPSLPDAMRDAKFWLIVGAFFFGSMGSQILHVHQVVFLVEHGISTMVGATVVSVIGIASILGKTGGGWLSDLIEREKVFVAGNLIMICSVFVLFLSAETGSVFIAYLFAVLLGVGYSANAAIAPAMMSDHFSGRYFGSILGVGLFGSAIGAALGPWIAGELFDFNGDYSLAFRLAILCGVLAAISGFGVKILKLATVRTR